MHGYRLLPEQASARPSSRRVVLLEQNDECPLKRRYMQLEGLQNLVENQTIVRLSAVVN